MSESLQTLHLPDTLANWPWPRQINPHLEEVSAEAKAWFHSFKALSPRFLLAYDKCDTGTLAALAYPHASKEHLRIGYDYMGLLVAVDAFTDVETASGARELVDIILDALNNPHKPRPEGENLLGEMTRQFWELATKSATASSQRHFIKSFTDYLNAVVDEAADRDSGTIRTVENYLKLRRETVTVRPSFFPAELALDLPDEAFYHPVIVELTYLAADLVLLDNDIFSYNKEQANGADNHNIITIAMHEFKKDLQWAIGWTVKYHAEVQTKFLDAFKRVPSFGPTIDKQLTEYVANIANMPRCNNCYCFEGRRYFGSKGLEIQKSRYVTLVPNMKIDPTLAKEHTMLAHVAFVEL